MATNPKKDWNEIYAEQVEASQRRLDEYNATLSAKVLVPSETVYVPTEELPEYSHSAIITIDKAHVLERLSTLSETEPVYFHEYAIKSDGRIVNGKTKVNRSDPNREAMQTLSRIVVSFLARKQFKPYTHSVIWVKAPKGKRVLKVQIKRRGS
jgi:hypothetical protein